MKFIENVKNKILYPNFSENFNNNIKNPSNYFKY